MARESGIPGFPKSWKSALGLGLFVLLVTTAVGAVSQSMTL